MLKVGIIEEVLIPLLKQLESAKNRALTENNDSEMKNMFEKIARDTNDIKEVLLERHGGERDLMYNFGLVSQHVDNMFDSATNETKTELQNIEQHITFIKGILIPQPEHSPGVAALTVEAPDSSLYSTFAVGESSNAASLNSTANYAQHSTAMTFSEETINMLDPQLRHCMYCLAVFPENSDVKKRLLIYWWISLGLVESTHGRRTAEENGEIILMELINTGLVIPIYRKHNSAVDRCRLQSQIRKLMISAAEENQFLSMNPEEYKEFRNENEKGTLQVFGTKIVQNEVLALFNIGRKYLKFKKSLHPKMQRMAVMEIGQWDCSESRHIEAEDTEFFEGFGLGLKYLSLCGISSIPELPDLIGKLSDLIILDLRACHNLEILTVKIASLKKLTHLDVSKCYLLDHMPKGLGSLTNLQVLKGFVIGNRRSKDPCRLSDLSSLTKLRKLSINIGRESTITEGEFTKLKEFTALRSLTITWGLHESKRDSATSQPSETEKLEKQDSRKAKKLEKQDTQRSLRTEQPAWLDQLSAPEKLEKLDIRCFPRANPPTWLNPTALGSLKRLYIRGGKLAQLDNKQGGTWKVEVLRLRFLNDFVIKWSELQSVFPNLLRVEYCSCPRLENFPRTDDNIWIKEEKDDHSQKESTSKNSGTSSMSKEDHHSQKERTSKNSGASSTSKEDHHSQKESTSENSGASSTSKED